MTEQEKCTKCGSPLPASVRGGLCPACLLKRGLETNTVGFTDDAQAEAARQWTPLTVEQLAPIFPELDILELIGRGGMGAVYKAREKQLDRLVALKILPPEIGREKSFADRFAREAQSMAKLGHPNIVTIYSFGQRGAAELAAGGDLYFFIMEYVDGLSLRQILDSGMVDSKEALAIVPQICDALQYAHDRGIVHRDIKPENILLNRQGQVKIADFGLAKLVGTPLPAGEDARRAGEGTPEMGSAAEKVTLAGEKVMGTPQYMAPEQIERPREVDHRADIYSLGVVFYQMLTGELPAGQFAPPSRRVQIDVRLDEVVLRALQREPQLRYQQVSEVKTEVETIAASGLEQINPSPLAGEGARRAGEGTPPSGRFSRLAIVGAAWAPFAFIAFVLAFSAHSVPAGSYHGPDPWQWLLIFTILPLGITAPFGTTICGAVAISRIRRSGGKLHGLGLALADALLFPLLALDVLIWAGMGRFVTLMKHPVSGHGAAMEALAQDVFYATVGTFVLSAIADCLIVYWAWRAARRPIEARPSEHPSPAGRGPTGPWREAGGEGTPRVGEGVPPPSQSGGDAAALHSARRAVKAPAIGMIVAAGINLALLLAVLAAVATPMLSREHAETARELAHRENARLVAQQARSQYSTAAETAKNRPVATRSKWSPLFFGLPALLGLPLNIVILFGAIRMMQLRNRGSAVAAAILALIAAPGNIIGLPMGIWALVVLSRREVMEAFKTSEKEKAMGRSKAWMWVLLAVAVIATPVVLWAASRPGEAPKTQPATQPAKAFTLDVVSETMQNINAFLRQKYPVRLCLENLDFDRAKDGITIEQAIARLEAVATSRRLSAREQERLTLARKYLDEGKPKAMLFDVGEWYSGHFRADSFAGLLTQVTDGTPYTWRQIGETFVILPRAGSKLAYPVDLKIDGLTVMQAVQKVVDQQPAGSNIGIVMGGAGVVPDGQTEATPWLDAPAHLEKVSAMEALCRITAGSRPDSVWELAGYSTGRGLGILPGPNKTASVPATQSKSQPPAMPYVFKTTPAAFANDVDPAVDKITVTFDRPMMDKSWSFTAGDKAFSDKTGSIFPERAGEIFYAAARTTCTMPVKLQPGKVYWVGVNSPQLQNFKSADGVPARPYQILFATRSDDGKPTPLPEELVKQAREINTAGQKVGLTLLLSRDDQVGGGAPGPHFRLTVRNGSGQVLKLNAGDIQFHCIDAAGRSYSTPLPTTRGAVVEEGVAPGAERLLRTTGCGGDGRRYSGWGPKDGGFTIWATGPQGLESNRIRVDLATTQPATQPAATFGTVIERILPDADTPGADTLFDLDKQRALRPYQGHETDPDEKYQAWLVENGVDIAARLHPTNGGLRCKDVAWTKVPQGQWDQMTAAEAIRMAGTLVPTGWSTMKPGPVDAAADWASRTFVFRTREGGVGLLQIVKFNEDPKTVSVRYKLVDSSAALRQTAQTFLTALRNKDMDAMKALSLGSVRGWVAQQGVPSAPSAASLPGMNVSRLEKAVLETHEEVYKDNLDLMTQIEDSAIDGDWAAAKVPVPPKFATSGKYLIVLFTRTSAGWRFVMLDDARKPLAEELSTRTPRLQELIASPTSRPATEPATQPSSSH